VKGSGSADVGASPPVAGAAVVPRVSDPVHVHTRDADFTLLNCDVLEGLRSLPDESVHCCLTSPPFYGLRDYGTGRWEGGDPVHEHDRLGARGGRGGSGTLDKRAGDAMPATVPAGVCSCGARYVDSQIGLEDSPEEWAARLVEVFAEVRRVLRSDGSLWIECGDSYCANSQGSPKPSAETKGHVNGWVPNSWGGGQATPMRHPTKPKDLLGQPFLLAFALRADGWYWRGCYPWAKPNAMPESAKDRCTVAHSYVLHFAKSLRYFFDGDAISEPAAWERWGDQSVVKEQPENAAASWIKPKGRDELIAIGNRRTNGQKERTDERRGFDNRLERADGFKHPRSVWTIPTQGYPEAHFATWPEALAARIIKAGTSEHGCCPTCGAPWTRETEPVGDYADALKEATWPSGGLSHGRGGPESARKKRTTTTTTTTTGWSPTCDCMRNPFVPNGGEPWDPTPCTVLDPFLGSGTTAYVARKLGRRSIGIELNISYSDLAARRMQQQSLFAQEATA